MGMDVWARESVWSGACTWVCEYACLCVCQERVPMHRCLLMDVCVCECLHSCMYIGVCICVCLGEREREREHLNRCMHIDMCVCVRERQREHMFRCLHMGMYVSARGSMVRCMHMGMCMCMFVCERESMGQMNAHGCLHLCVLAQVPSHGSGQPSSGVLRLGMWRVLCLPTWGGKQRLLLDLLRMASGWATWGSRYTDCRDSRLGTYSRCPRSTNDTG